MIEARDVSVAIGGKRIVASVDFAARPGEISAIVGPNGSGKTTFLRALSGELAYTGSIALNGRELSGMKPVEVATHRAVLSQATTLSFPFTVREIVRLGLVGGRSGVLPGEDTRLPERALARVDLDGLPGAFRGRTAAGPACARALPGVGAGARPRYLFLDEPVSSLDIKHQLIIMNIVNIARDFARRSGGVVAILHDLNLTAMYADRIFVMHRGRFAAAGAPQEVLNDDLIEKVLPAEGRCAAGRQYAVRAAAIGSLAQAAGARCSSMSMPSKWRTFGRAATRSAIV